MGNDSKSTCKVASHHLLKDKAKNRVEDLHLMFTDIQLARRESRSGNVAILEEQVHQMLREWQAELTEPSPATSLHANSLGSFSTELGRLLREIEEEDDAISPLKHGPEIHPSKPGETVAFKEAGHFNCINEGVGSQGFQQFNDSTPAFHNTVTTNLEPSAFIHGTPITNETEALLFQHNTDSLLEASNFHHTSISTDTDYFQYSENEIYISSSSVEQFGADGFSDVSGLLLMNIHPSPSAFLGPKCALWDCDRPVQGSDWCQHYCSTFHATLAAKEGPPGMAPLLRPGGINLKDGPLFVALRAKIEGKDVGIPECGGAATSKSPWNAPELVSKATVSFLATMGTPNITHQQALAQVEARAQQFNQQSMLQITNEHTLNKPVQQDEPLKRAAAVDEEPKPFIAAANVDRPSYDGYNWRKYGQKQVKGSEYPRSYYKCSHPNCPVKKKVERTFDGQIAAIVYKGEHNHQKPQPPKRSSSAAQGENDPKLSNNVNELMNLDRNLENCYPKKSQPLASGNLDNSCGRSFDCEDGSKGLEGLNEMPKNNKRRKSTNTSNEVVQDPRASVQNGTETEIVGDGFRWKKYGQKVVKGNPYPRSYYKCTSIKCNVRKYAERASEEPSAFLTTYEGKHNHEMPVKVVSTAASQPDSNKKT